MTEKTKGKATKAPQRLVVKARFLTVEERELLAAHQAAKARKAPATMAEAAELALYGPQEQPRDTRTPLYLGALRTLRGGP